MPMSKAQLLLGAMALVYATPVLAKPIDAAAPASPTASDAAADASEILVTARRRPENAQQVPAALSVVIPA